MQIDEKGLLEALSYMLTLTLVDHDWQLYLQPGQFYLERDGVKLESGSVVANLKSGKTNGRELGGILPQERYRRLALIRRCHFLKRRATR